jgi:hypothetical protein
MRVALLMVVVAGCSFGLTSAPEPHRPCPTSLLGPAIDSAIAIGSLVASIGIVVEGGENYAQSSSSAYASMAGITAALFTVAATRGFQNVGECKAHQRELAREALASRPFVPPPERLAAWDLTKKAAVAARQGDCQAVASADRALVDIDREFRDTVFARDVAIARCLAKPASTPAATQPEAPTP